jgi:hypothetical protein
MKMDREGVAPSSNGKRIGTDGSGKQGRMCSSAGGGYKDTVSTNGYGNVKVPQSRKMG